MDTVKRQQTSAGINQSGVRARSENLLLSTLQRHGPMPGDVFRFLERGIATLSTALSAAQRARICGIGVAAPHEMWNWTKTIGAPKAEFDAWKQVDIRQEVSRFSALPVYVEIDATEACRAELNFGRGRSARNYAHFYIGSFVGGGVVMNHSVVDGNQSNAGAFGSLRSRGDDGTDAQLIDTASLHLLEADLRRYGLDPARLWHTPQDWSDIFEHVTRWIDAAAPALATAILSVCAVIDFEAVVIDGSFPTDLVARLVARVDQHLLHRDARHPAAAGRGRVDWRQCPRRRRGRLRAKILAVLSEHQRRSLHSGLNVMLPSLTSPS